jgi:hypothetical protein
MIGRQVTAALRRPLHARLCTIAAPQPHFNLVIRTFTHAARLLDGPTGRPRKAVGEPSRPVKRAVKSAAKKPANPEKDAAAKKLAEKKKSAKQRVADRALATKERRALKLQEKKAAAAAKEASKTPEQIAMKERRARMADNLALKKAALQPPSTRVKVSAYGQFTGEKGKDLSDLLKDSDKSTKPSIFSQHAKNVSAAFKELSPADIEVGSDPGKDCHETREL